MKILFLTMEFPEGIISNNYSLIETCNYLSERGYNVYLLSPRGFNADINEKFEYIQVGFKYHKILIDYKNFRRSLFTFDYLVGIILKIKKISPDLLICNGTGSFLYLKPIFSIFLSKLMKIPIIQVWTGTDLLSTDSKFNKFVKRYILSKSTLNMLQSIHMKERALKITAKGNLIVIPNKGVDLVRFRKEQISPKLNVNNKNIVRLLYVGRFHPIKGIDYLIEAFAKLNKNYQGVILDIIGITPDKKKYYKKIYEENLLEKIRFRGIIPYEEINNYYRKADILILPSLMEGLSNVLMEAMACGLPIVATNVGGNTELVLPGKGGLLIPPKDTISLSNAILKLVKNPDLRKRMGSYNIKAIKPYNSKNIMKRKEIIINFLYNHFN